MKRTVLAGVTLAALVSATAVAAAEVSTGWDFVAFGGGSRGYFSGNDKVLLGTESRNAYVVGLGVMFRPNPDFGFELDVRYAEKGGQGSVDVTDYSKPNQGPNYVGSGTTKLGYVEIPIVMAGHLATGDRTYLRGYAGPSINVLTQAEFEGQLGGVPVSGYDIKDALQSIDYNIVIGASFVYDVQSVSFWVDGRWSIGLNSISDTAASHDIKNNSLEWVLGVGLPLARE